MQEDVHQCKKVDDDPHHREGGAGLGKSTLARRPQNAPQPPSPVGEAHLVMWEDAQVR